MPTMKDLKIDQFPPEQRAELARRDAELDADPASALTWEQIRASVDGKPRTPGRDRGAA